MNKKTLFLITVFLVSLSLYAQQPAVKPLRIADTLTVQERNNHNRVILQSELDSLIGLYNATHVKPVIQEPPVKIQKEETPWILFIVIGVALLIIGALMYLLFYNQKKTNKVVGELNRHIRGLEFEQLSSSETTAAHNLEKKIMVMHIELQELQGRNHELEHLLIDYERVKNDFEQTRKRISEIYKIKNYPGNDPAKEENELVEGWLNTEKSVASYAYEKFLKPILAIADSNKNNPGRINEEESEKLLQLLVSLSLLYIEYLYLRINDLSIGGKMVQRIQGLSKGNGLDTGLLKQLNTEHGSRALVLRMVLDAMHIKRLSYPVFDETNLNLS